MNKGNREGAVGMLTTHEEWGGGIRKEPGGGDRGVTDEEESAQKETGG